MINYVQTMNKGGFMKQCKYLDNHHTRCPFMATISPDYSDPPNVVRKHIPTEPQVSGISLQVYFDTQPNDYCFYHQRKLKGESHDSKGNYIGPIPQKSRPIKTAYKKRR